MKSCTAREVVGSTFISRDPSIVNDPTIWQQQCLHCNFPVAPDHLFHELNTTTLIGSVAFAQAAEYLSFRPRARPSVEVQLALETPGCPEEITQPESHHISLRLRPHHLDRTTAAQAQLVEMAASDSPRGAHVISGLGFLIASSVHVTQVAAAKLAPHSIRVNAISPTAIADSVSLRMHAVTFTLKCALSHRLALQDLQLFFSQLLLLCCCSCWCTMPSRRQARTLPP